MEEAANETTNDNTTLGILEQMTASEEALTSGEIARRAGMHRASVYRNAEALVASGWLRSTSNPRRYSPSWKLLSLGLAMLHRDHERDVVLSQACLLAHATQNPVQVCFYDDGSSFWTDSVILLEGVPIVLSQGVRLPGIATSSGKVLLAFQSEEEINRVLGIPQPRFTDDTITDTAQIRRELEIAQAQGYASARGEHTPGVGGFSVPIFNRSGFAVASLGMASPIESQSLAHLDTGLKFAGRASTELGYRPLQSIG